jgi:hypothetical protein
MAASRHNRNETGVVIDPSHQELLLPVSVDVPRHDTAEVCRIPPVCHGERIMNYSKISLSVAAGLCFALSVQAQQPQSSNTAKNNAGNVKVAIDPSTGRIRDLTPEESAALSKAATQKRSTADIARYGSAPADNAAAARTVRKAADGSVSVRVPKSAMTQLHARVGADGKIIVSESGHSDAAAPAEAME